MSKYLFGEKPIVIDVELAASTSVNEAIVIQQIHYWIEKNKKANTNFVNGRYWTYNSISDWKEKAFPFWSYDTVKRIFKRLEANGILITDNFNKQKRDKTKWYSIDYEVIEKILKNDKSEKCDLPNALGQKAPITIGQDAPMDQGKKPQPLPEITTEITTDINKSSCSTSENPNQEDSLSNFDSSVIDLTDFLIRKITENNARAPVPDKDSKNYLKWVDEIDKLKRLGPVGGSKGYSIKEIHSIIEWCQDNSFWKNNILSASKLREKVVQLENKMNMEKSKGGGTHGANRRPNEKRGPSSETRRLERIAKDKGFIKPGGIKEPDIDF